MVIDENKFNNTIGIEERNDEYDSDRYRVLLTEEENHWIFKYKIQKRKEKEVSWKKTRKLGMKWTLILITMAEH